MPKRKPAVSGLFYTDNKTELAKQVRHYIDTAEIDFKNKKSALEGVIAPHAGYIYSGYTAGYGYKLLNDAVKNDSEKPVFVIAGPAHRVALNQIALPESDVFVTPMGEASVDLELADLLKKNTGVIASEQAHLHEHSLETQLPFLQTICDNCTILPLVIGNCDKDYTAGVFEFLSQQKQRKLYFILSTDLSHFLSLEQAEKKDKKTIDFISSSKTATITSDMACGVNVLNGFLSFAEKNSYDIEKLHYSTSYEASHDKNRVVGYASFAIYHQ